MMAKVTGTIHKTLDLHLTGLTVKQMEALLKGSTINESIARDALAIKRSAKKSWAKLGVSDEVAAMIESLAK